MTLIEAAVGLEFVGFSNPDYWNLERLLGKSPEMIERAQGLSDRQRYRLTEVLDPEITHYEFFLYRPPLDRSDWSDDQALLNAIPERSPCMEGWPARQIFNADYKIMNLSDAEWEFLKLCDENTVKRQTVKRLLEQLSDTVACELTEVRSLTQKQLVLLSQH